VFWLVHVYAAMVGSRAERGHRATSAELRAETLRELPMLQAALPAVAALVLGAAGVWSKNVAVWVAISTGLGALAACGFLLARKEGVGLLGSLGLAAISALFGLMMVLLKALVH
jgi:hypothetical protein